MLRQHLPYLLQQDKAVRAEEGIIAVGKQMPNIAQCRDTQQRIHDSMGQHIRIAVSQQASVIRDIHTADDAFPAFRQAVHIIAMSNSHLSILPFRIASPRITSSGVVILMFS